MSGLMLPSAWPALSLYRQFGKRRQVVAFVVAYLGVWLAVAPLAMLAAPPVAAALAVAGLYQLGPLQARFLDRCRAPLGLLVRRSGVGAGLEYGVTCAGCCGGLMLGLAAAGLAMAPAGMAAMGAVSAAEKELARGVLFGRVVGVALLAAAVLVVLR